MPDHENTNTTASAEPETGRPTKDDQSEPVAKPDRLDEQATEDVIQTNQDVDLHSPSETEQPGSPSPGMRPE